MRRLCKRRSEEKPLPICAAAEFNAPELMDSKVFLPLFRQKRQVLLPYLPPPFMPKE
jgi:hypothetical protein